MYSYLLFGLISAAIGSPQGYNYPVPLGVSQFTRQLLPPAQSYLPPSQQYLPPPIPQFSSNRGYDYTPPFIPFNSGRSSFVSTAPSFSSSHHHQHHNQAPIITKHFYFHSAPEDYSESQPKIIRLGAPRRNYRVIFIKAPSQSGRSSISVVPEQKEERTVIYVLTKQSDASDIKATVQDTPTRPSKPEVFFIKYKTQEEALHAQRQIQAQFETLGGTTQVTNEGTAPVSSVIGSTERESSQHNFISGGTGFSSSSLTSNQYLPPNK